MKITLKRKSGEAEALRETVRQQKARIEELKRENADLLFTLDEYTKKENSILESIGYLEEKKREQTESLNKKYAAELEKLQFFEDKWLNIVKNSDDPSLKTSVAHTRETLRACREEILRETRRELRISKIRTAPEEDFLSETARLGSLPKDDGFDPDAGFPPAEYAKYRRAVKNAVAEDPDAEPPSNRSERFAGLLKPEDPEPRRTAAPGGEVEFVPLRSRYAEPGTVGNTDDSEPTGSEHATRDARSDLREHGNPTRDEPERARYGEFPPEPKRDDFPSVPIAEPPEPVSPKKMSDKEIMSLLERLSV